MQMKVSTLKAKSALFDVNKIKGSENKILTATKDIRKDYDSSRGFGLATLTAITTYKDPKQGFKSRDEFESLLYEALAHGASDIFISPDRPITMMKDLDLYSLTHRIINRDEALHILRTIADENAYLVLINNKFISVHDKFHRTLILSGFCLLKIAKISLNSSFFPKPIKR